MTDASNGANGASGRFLRIEQKLDDILDEVGDVRERLTVLETRAKVSNEQSAVKVSDRQFRLMKAGIFVTIALGVFAPLIRWWLG